MYTDRKKKCLLVASLISSGNYKTFVEFVIKEFLSIFFYCLVTIVYLHEL